MKYLEISEDIVSDTFLKASESWAVDGIPENPTAWLYTVAKNKTKDYFKHIAIFETQIKDNIDSSDIQTQHEFEFDNQSIADSQLAMIFAICNPSNSKEGQICLALQILCGFSVEEIASAFFTKTETVKKRLHRAKKNLRNQNFEIGQLNEAEIESRLDIVLNALYLLFNEGYLSKTNNKLIRKELCFEAIRLALVLTEYAFTSTPQVYALLSLMCYQSSRLEARVNENGETILFEQQDRASWDQSLIERGNYYLINASNNNEISKYHLEAAIAYWHTTTKDQNKWQHILQLYNQLILIEYSPATALSRAFAFSKVYGQEKGLEETLKLKLIENYYYYELLGYLYSNINCDLAIQQFEKAIDLTRSKIEKQTLRKEIKRLLQLR